MRSMYIRFAFLIVNTVNQITYVVRHNIYDENDRILYDPAGSIHENK